MTRPAPSLLVVGDCNPDLVLTGDDLVPEFGQVEKLADSAALVLGGSGAITAMQAAKLGVPTAFVGVVGKDTFGEWCLAELAQAGVDVSGCGVDPERHTGATVVLSTGGDRAMLTHRGAIASLVASTVPLDLLTGARHVHFAAYFLNAGITLGLPTLAVAVRRRGATVSLDPNWDPSGRWDLGIHDAIRETDMFFANENETVAIAGRVATMPEATATEDLPADAPLTSATARATDIAAATEALASYGTSVIVKRGEKGALFVSGPVSRTVAAPMAPGNQVIDTTGAGDSFDAGYLAGYLAGMSVPDSMLLGCYCGMRVVTAIGGTTSQPTGDDVLRDLGIRL